MARAKGRSPVASKGGRAWDGRFSQKTNRLVESFTVSVAVDRRLYAHDVQGSIAHCKTLGRARVLTASETRTIVQGLESVKTELDRGRFRFTLQDEDIHMAIERRLTELIGPLGGKLHTAGAGTTRLRWMSGSICGMNSVSSWGIWKTFSGSWWRRERRIERSPCRAIHIYSVPNRCCSPIIYWPMWK